MCFKRKKTAEIIKENREYIATNAEKIQSLIVLAQDNIQLKKELCELQEEIKYLRPSEAPAVRNCDTKIKNLIDDLKFALNKSGGEDNEKTKKLIQNIRLTVAERNTKI